MISAEMQLVVEQLHDVHQVLESMQRQFDDRLRYDSVREQQVSRLYEELDAYKRAENDERVLDLARGLFLVLDKLDPDHPASVPIEMVRDELLDILAAVGIDLIEGEAGTLDARSETVVGFFDDVECERCGESIRVVGDGYRMGDRIVRPRRVLTRRPVATEPEVDPPVSTDGIRHEIPFDDAMVDHRPVPQPESAWRRSDVPASATSAAGPIIDDAVIDDGVPDDMAVPSFVAGPPLA